MRALVLLLILGACTRLPAEDARATPAEAVAARGFAQIALHGVPLGSALAVAPGLLLTNAHVLPEGAAQVTARPGDGGAPVAARLLARSPGLDLAVLAVPIGLFTAATPAAAPPRIGETVWAVGAPRAGPALAIGQVERLGVDLPPHGPGFTARMPALMGYSGGPVVDDQGRVHGLVTALVRPGAAPLLAAMTGLDLDGMAQGAREVFVLSLPAAMAEARRLTE
jgi:S1-C subfamily serine protease